jgi:rhodanese-related sulfurtransferase
MTVSTSSTAPRFRRIDAAAAAELICKKRSGELPILALFDVRDRATFERAHIAGAEHLTEAQLAQALRRVAKHEPVMIYCYHGNASQVYAETFADFRYLEVYSVDGGFDPLHAALVAREGVRKVPVLPATASAELTAFIHEFGFDAADLDAAREHDLSPLMRAALIGHAELIAELLPLGVDLQRRNADGNNALWLACVSRDPASVQSLVAAGIDVNNVNDLGATCLMYAASSGRDTMVAELLKAGADPYIRNFDDVRAVDLAATLPCLKLLRHTAN